MADEVAIAMTDVGVTVDNNGKPATLLHDVSLSIQRGERLVIVGPSGSGKSTLLRAMNRLMDADGGSITVLGRAIAEWSPRELRQRVAMVGQEPNLLDRTVEQNLRLPLELNRIKADDISERMRKVLSRVGLKEELLERDDSQLSVGQKQRVCLARALMTEPPVLLLDEPTASLDVRAAEQLDDLITQLHDAGVTVVVVTHRLEEARSLDGRLVVMIDGTIAAQGDADALLDDPPQGPVRDFLLGDDDAA